jgi:hypothetical protein
MPRSVWFAFLFLLLPLSVTAQDFPKFELSGGYSFFHVSSGLSPDSTAFAADDSNLHGWNVTAVGNLTRRFGLEADFGGYGGNIAYGK